MKAALITVIIGRQKQGITWLELLFIKTFMESIAVKEDTTFIKHLSIDHRVQETRSVRYTILWINEQRKDYR